MEVLIVGIITGVATRLGERWLDGVAEYLDTQTRALVKRLATTIANPNGPQAADSVAIARDHLTVHIKAHPEARHALVEAALTVRQAPDMARQFEAFLVTAFEVIGRLSPAIVALPGFFNGTEYVTVIDVRTEDGGPMRVPIHSWEDELGHTSSLSATAESAIWFEPSHDVLFGVPRIWLLETTQPGQRDELVRTLTSHFQEDAPSPGTVSATLHLEYLNRVASIGHVVEITAGKVSVTPYLGSPTQKISSRIDSPQGIKLFKSALIARIEEKRQFHEVWDEALDPTAVDDAVKELGAGPSA